MGFTKSHLINLTNLSDDFNLIGVINSVTRRLRKKIARFLGKVAKEVAKNKQQKITCKKVAQKVA